MKEAGNDFIKRLASSGIFLERAGLVWVRSKERVKFRRFRKMERNYK
jgi:hypothetical protein